MLVHIGPIEGASTGEQTLVVDDGLVSLSCSKHCLQTTAQLHRSTRVSVAADSRAQLAGPSLKGPLASAAAAASWPATQRLSAIVLFFVVWIPYILIIIQPLSPRDSPEVVHEREVLPEKNREMKA
jgi:hypothetical protein